MSAAAGPSMSAADELLALAEEAGRRRDFSTATSCLESALSPAHAASLLPLAEAHARLRLADLLLASAKANLERALLVLNQLPSALPRLKLLAPRALPPRHYPRRPPAHRLTSVVLYSGSPCSRSLSQSDDMTSIGDGGATEEEMAESYAHARSSSALDGGGAALLPSSTVRRVILTPRYVVNRVTSGDYDCPRKVLSFLTDLHASFRMLNLRNDFLRKKFDGMKYDLRRVEEVFYDVKIRGLVPGESKQEVAQA